MRKFLLASVATLGTAGGLMGTALAQAPVVVEAPRGAPSQGQAAYPLVNPFAAVNSNNNYQASALPGALANPTPGTIVVHINGRVQTEFQAAWTSVDERPTAAGTSKREPLALNNFMRLYFGADAMATNGLRYGAAIELRQNFATVGSNSSSNASTNSSLQTVYVRRAFGYAAGDNWGIVRVGMADGLIGIFDNGVTTGQFTFIGELNGGDTQNIPSSVPPTFYFLSQAGNEYDIPKLVYISPQFAGFDFGVQYAPTVSNGYAVGGGTAGGVTAALSAGCSVANPGCPTLSTGPGANDGARALNLAGLGVRYQGKFGPVGLLAYASYQLSGHSTYSGSTARAVLLGSAAAAAALPNSQYNGQFQGLSFGNGGMAVTFAGFTIGGNVIGGRINGQYGLVPQNGSNEFAYTLSAKYVTGPFTVGIVGEIGWQQGNPLLAGVSQRRGRALAVGMQYNVAPGFSVAAEYGYNDQQQSRQDFLNNVIGSNANNYVHGQSLIIGSNFTF